MSYVEDDRATLSHGGFVRMDEGFSTAAEAFELARSMIEAGYAASPIAAPHRL
jgi:hypothetical protein